MRLRRIAPLLAAAVGACGVAVAPVAADPTAKNPNALAFTVTCPGMDPFDAVVVGAVGFVEGDRKLAIAQFPGQGSFNLIPCTASGPQGTIPVFLQVVQRGG